IVSGWRDFCQPLEQKLNTNNSRSAMSCRSLISWRHSIGWRITTSERNQRWAPCWNTANGASSGRCCPSALLVKLRVGRHCWGCAQSATESAARFCGGFNQRRHSLSDVRVDPGDRHSASQGVKVKCLTWPTILIPKPHHLRLGEEQFDGLPVWLLCKHNPACSIYFPRLLWSSHSARCSAACSLSKTGDESASDGDRGFHRPCRGDRQGRHRCSSPWVH